MPLLAREVTYCQIILNIRYVCAARDNNHDTQSILKPKFEAIYELDMNQKLILSKLLFS
jgi:hypothetical protein